MPGTERFFVYGSIALVLYMYQPKGIMAIVETIVSKMKGSRA
jgi:branched-chain amino acid transport system permease protein